MTNRAARRTNLKRRPKAMKLVEAQVNATSADDLHAKLVAQGVARRGGPARAVLGPVRLRGDRPQASVAGRAG